MKSTFFFCLHNEAVSFEKKKQVHRQWPSRKKKNPEPPAAIFLTHTGWAHFYVKKKTRILGVRSIVYWPQYFKL